jgi:hypothetical protein
MNDDKNLKQQIQAKYWKRKNKKVFKNIKILTDVFPNEIDWFNLVSCKDNKRIIVINLYFRKSFDSELITSSNYQLKNLGCLIQIKLYERFYSFQVEYMLIKNEMKDNTVLSKPLKFIQELQSSTNNINKNVTNIIQLSPKLKKVLT